MVSSPNDFLAANLAVARQRWPRLFHLLEAAEEDLGRLSLEIPTSTPEQTLVVNGIHLTSSYDRRREADLQASRIPQEATSAWVYGMALGDLPRTLLRRPGLRSLRVVLLNPAVALASFSVMDHLDWLQDPRLELTAACFLEEIALPFAASPACLTLADDDSARIRDLVALELATPYINARHQDAGEHLRKRLADNRNLLRRDGDVRELFGRHQGETVYVSAVGPSIDAQFDWLRENRGNSPLIVVDAALRPFTMARIFPDYVVTVDSLRDGVAPFFRETDLSLYKDTPLVYFPTVHRDVLELWPGPRFAAYGAGDRLYDEMLAELPRATLFSAGSVIHPATDLAVKMGASHVVLLGCDFSFPHDLNHARNSVYSQKREEKSYSKWVVNGRGERVGTSSNLQGYLRDLERLVLRTREVRFINSSREGARIAGTSYLEEAAWQTRNGMPT